MVWDPFDRHRGVSLSQALRMFCGCADELDWLEAHAEDDLSQRPSDWWERKQQVEQILVDKLTVGHLEATAFTLPLSVDSCRSAISRDLWELLEVNVDESAACFRTIRLDRIKVRESFCGMMFGRVVSAKPRTEIQICLSDDDGVLEIGEDRMYLRGEIQQSIIRTLVDNLAAGKKQRASEILKDAGSNADTVAKAFTGSPNWKRLKRFIRQERGYVWLEAIERPEQGQESLSSE